MVEQGMTKFILLRHFGKPERECTSKLRSNIKFHNDGLEAVLLKSEKEKKTQHTYVRMLIYSHWGTDERKEITDTNTGRGKYSVSLQWPVIRKRTQKSHPVKVEIIRMFNKVISQQRKAQKYINKK